MDGEAVFEQLKSILVELGLVLDESEELAPHFESLATLARLITSRLGSA